MSDSAAHLARPLAQRVLTLPPAVRSATPVRPAAEGVIDAALEALAAGKTHYTDRPGILPLRQRVTAYLAGLGFEASPDAITITCGVEEARFVALKQWAAGSTVFAEQPSALVGTAALISARFVTPAQTAAVCYTSSVEALQVLVHDLPSDYGGWVVWQIAHGEVDAREAMENAAARGLNSRVLAIGDMPGMSGWRVGFMAGSSAAGKLRAFKQSMTICTPSVSQWAALGIEDEPWQPR
jgi:hypothetical protein